MLVARSTQNATLGAVVQAGTGGSASSDITASSTSASATVSATQSVTATAGEASGIARTEGVDGASLWSRATAVGLSGTASAASTSTSGTRTAAAEAHATTRGNTVADARATYAPASSLGLPNLSGGSNGLSAFSYSYGALTSGALTAIMTANPTVAAAMGGSYSVIGAGVLGANYSTGASGSQTYTAVATYTFTVNATTPVLLGLLDFTHHGGGFDSLTLTATRGAATVFSTSFTSVANAAAYIDDRAVSLSNFNAGVRTLKLTYTLVADSAQGADMSYLLTANAGAIAAGAPVTAAAPEAGGSGDAVQAGASGSRLAGLAGLQPTMAGSEQTLRTLGAASGMGSATAGGRGADARPTPARAVQQR
jgi:hypothetical protein